MAAQDEGPLDLYANFARVTAGTYELTLEFGLQTPHEEGREELVRVRMSPQHAKALKILLGNALDAYETEVMQEIRLPQNLLERLGAGEESREDDGD